MKTFLIFSLSSILFIGCSKNEAEYYGYARKEEANPKPAIKLSTSENISKAIQDNDWSAILELIKGGLSPNKILESGRTLLNESVIWDREDIFKNLIQNGADPKVKDENGQDTLEICQEKINFLVLINPVLLDKYQSDFLSFLEQEDIDELKTLLEQKLNPNFALPSGETPLTYAVSNNLENVVRLLVSPSYKIDIHQKNNDKKTALLLSQELKYTRIERILKSRGAQY